MREHLRGGQWPGVNGHFIYAANHIAIRRVRVALATSADDERSHRVAVEISPDESVGSAIEIELKRKSTARLASDHDMCPLSWSNARIVRGRFTRVASEVKVGAARADESMP